MGFKCGIIGLPNVGKSTLFNALTKSNIAVADNFPFCTITPNIGVVSVNDPRLDLLRGIVKPQRIIPTTIEFVDIAGLVKGASKGEGLGNKFLTNIRETDAIAHVVRCFENETIIHINNKVNPLDDIEIINTELVISDLDTCESALKRIQKKSNENDKNNKYEFTVLEKCLYYLEHCGMLRMMNMSEQDKSAIRHLNFLSLKPTMYIANIQEEGFKNNIYLDQVYKIAATENAAVATISASIEADMNAMEMEEKERTDFMIEIGIEEHGLDNVIRTGYSLLNLRTFFTVGLKEIRAWTISSGATALHAAGKIHSDFKKGFIRAQTISFKDFIAHKGELGAKKNGKMRLEGKDYIVQDGDIMNFLFKV